jgi:hypothetical protein
LCQTSSWTDLSSIRICAYLFARDERSKMGILGKKWGELLQLSPDIT